MNRLCFFVLVIAAAIGPRADAAEPAGLDSMQATLAEYFETQRLISKERGDWKLAKELLEDRVSLMASQIEELEAKTAEENQNITEADVERDKLQTALDALVEVQTLQQEQIAQLERRTRQLTKSLPEGMVAKLGLLMDKLPKADATPEEVRATLSERYQNVLGILNEANRFNADIVTTNERHLIADGRNAEVRTLYLGLGQAYFAGTGETADSAGLGIPDEGGGWKWVDRDGLARAAGEAIGIQAGETVPAFVSLPVQIDAEVKKP